jgi:hypothetical protein
VIITSIYNSTSTYCNEEWENVASLQVAASGTFSIEMIAFRTEAKSGEVPEVGGFQDGHP